MFKGGGRGGGGNSTIPSELECKRVEATIEKEKAIAYSCYAKTKTDQLKAKIDELSKIMDSKFFNQFSQEEKESIRKDLLNAIKQMGSE